MQLLETLGLSLPIVQAPMAGVATPAMAAAVSEAGALGSISVGATDAAGAKSMFHAVRALTQRPFNVNVFCHQQPTPNRHVEDAWLNRLRPEFANFDAEPPEVLQEIYPSFLDSPEMLEALVLEKPAVVSFHFGLPSAEAIGRLKAVGTILFCTATSLAEAEQAIAQGVDAIVAQGYEAGGHRGVFDPQAPDSCLGTLALTRLVAARIHAPVIAAGGIMDGAGIAAALHRGAAAAQLGTAFIACSESDADHYFRGALFGSVAMATEMTALISGRPARCIPNSFTRLKSAEPVGAASPDYPIAYHAGKALDAAARKRGNGGYGAHWAGQGAPMARSMPASELVNVLGRELAASLQRVESHRRGAPISRL